MDGWMEFFARNVLNDLTAKTSFYQFFPQPLIFLLFILSSPCSCDRRRMLPSLETSSIRSSLSSCRMTSAPPERGTRRLVAPHNQKYYSAFQVQMHGPLQQQLLLLHDYMQPHLRRGMERTLRVMTPVVAWLVKYGR